MSEALHKACAMSHLSKAAIQVKTALPAWGAALTSSCVGPAGAGSLQETGKPGGFGAQLFPAILHSATQGSNIFTGYNRDFIQFSPSLQLTRVVVFQLLYDPNLVIVFCIWKGKVLSSNSYSLESLQTSISRPVRPTVTTWKRTHLLTICCPKWAKMTKKLKANEF